MSLAKIRRVGRDCEGTVLEREPRVRACQVYARYVRIVLCAADSRQAVLAVRVGYTYLLLLTVREPRRPLGVLPFIACQEVWVLVSWIRTNGYAFRLSV